MKKNPMTPCVVDLEVVAGHDGEETNVVDYYLYKYCSLYVVEGMIIQSRSLRFIAKT
jgi:hypothetical protein